MLIAAQPRLFARVHAGPDGQQSLVPCAFLSALFEKRNRAFGIQAYPIF